MPTRLLFTTLIQLWQWSSNPYLEEPSCVVLHRSEMTLFVYIDRTRCHHWHRIVIQRGQNKHTSGYGLTGERFSKINSYGGNPFLESDMRASLSVRLFATLSHAPSLCASYKSCTILVLFSAPHFCFLHRFSVQIICRLCNSRLVRPIGSQSSASAYTLLVDSVLLMRRFTLLCSESRCLWSSSDSFYCLIDVCEIFSPLLRSNLSCWCKEKPTRCTTYKLVYFVILYVSGLSRPIIRRHNHMFTTIGNYYFV
jgi:hypothetical protein